MTQTEQTAMRHYAEKRGYTTDGVHSDSNNSYGLVLKPVGVVYWDAAAMKERIDDRERETGE